MACQETNGADGSSIRPPVAELRPVAGRMKMPFRDTRVYYTKLGLLLQARVCIQARASTN